MTIALKHPKLVSSLRLAYSAERAAAFAYIGHAGSLRNPAEIEPVQQIEQDEWDHRRHVLAIMNEYGIAPSKWLELKFYIIGKVIGFSCYLIGRFMPYFFAGKLESGNVCEYFIMLQHFHSLGITHHDELLYEMGMKEKEHEVYFWTSSKTRDGCPGSKRSSAGEPTPARTMSNLTKNTHWRTPRTTASAGSDLGALKSIGATH